MFLEAAKGRESAQWNVYRREWFIGLLGVLAANIAAVTVTRWSGGGPGWRSRPSACWFCWRASYRRWRAALRAC